MTEQQSYHALNCVLQSNYAKLQRLKIAHQTWYRAWQHESQQYSSCNPEKLWGQLESEGIQLYLQDDASYPALLKEISYPPLGIYIKGSLPGQSLPQEASIAIVGTRKATLAGKTAATALARDLSQYRIPIISGLALGIDQAAHFGALEASGHTYAVLATGLDRVYPRQHIALAQQILEHQGGLISEYTPGTASLPHHFLQRNRIVSGLSRATIVIEAPEHSGSLVTAQHALEQNREVFIVPGPIQHPNYRGSHQLIRAGARLITSAKDILEDLNIDLKKTPSLPFSSSHPHAEEQIVLDIIKELGWPCSIDKIGQISKIEIPKVNRIITFLTLNGQLPEL